MRPIPLLALVVLVPTAAALDLLPDEATLGEVEARFLVRSSDGAVRIETEPSVLAAASAPGGDAGEFRPTPRALEATHVWRGLDGVTIVVLRRADPSTPIDIVIGDGARTGVWIEWPALGREVPLPAATAVLAGVGAMLWGSGARRVR